MTAETLHRAVTLPELQTADGRASETAYGGPPSLRAIMLRSPERFWRSYRSRVKETTMPLSNSRRRLATAIAGALLIALSSAALAADAPAAPATPTRAMREGMATLHEEMAACLRSEKPLSECRAEMQKHCQAMMGKQGCTRMMGTGGMMGMGRGMMGMGKGMHGPMTSSPPSSPPR